MRTETQLSTCKIPLCQDPSWGASVSYGEPVNVGPQAPELSGLDYQKKMDQEEEDSL